MSASPKVLIVEDEAIIALDIETQLTQLGFAICGTVRSAGEAFELIEKGSPDLILMDIRIQGDLDGIQAAAMIRDRHHLPVIYLTAHADDATLARAEATEPFGYIVKPLQHFKLKAIITMALRRHKAERELEQSQTLLSNTLEELAIAKRAAEAANHAKSDFLARMSHEIRTPMNLIMGMTELVLESELNAKQKQQLEIAHRNVKRLLRLINGILDLSKVEAGELTFAAVPFDLTELLNECAATMTGAIERKGLSLEILMDVTVWRYWIGDSLRLQQVLLNLIGNSIKFTAEGRIDVRVRPHLNDQGQKGLHFEVSDTGCGVPRDKTALIFEAFQQVDGSINRRYEGTGLGLAIAKTLVERMGGQIWVDETAGAGTKFSFTAVLPQATDEEFRRTLESRAPKIAVSQLAAGSQILLVEDNADNVALVKAYLENLPVTLDVAENGVEAIAKRRAHEYGVILMDVQMPVMDGYAATRAIRAWEKEQGARRTPIVAVTAHALNGASAASLAAGCDAHLPKPIERNELLEAIATFTAMQARPEQPQKLPDLISARRPLFLANRQADLEKLLAALRGGDFATIQLIAHNCKGTGTGYGFPRISELGALIEKAAKASDSTAAGSLIQEFNNYLDSVGREAA